MNNIDVFDNNFITFIKHIEKIFINNDFINKLYNENVNQRLERIKKFNNSINDTTLFNYLLKKKIKLFSNKEKNTKIVSESIFGSEITLKKIFNNQDEDVKLLFWNDLVNLLISYNEYILNENDNDLIQNLIIDKINKLKENNNNKKQFLNPKEGLNKILNTDNLNETTNDMINDIFGTFENSLNDPNSNPFANIMNISQTISEKYKNKIENGEINLDNILKNMTSLPGMENMGNVVEMLSKQIIPSNNEPKETIIIDENFSTALVKKEEENINNLNIGNLLNIFNNPLINSINEISKKDNKNDNINEIDNIDEINNVNEEDILLNNKNESKNDINKLMNIFGKLSQTNNPSQLSNLIENELGVDMNKFTNEISKVLINN